MRIARRGPRSTVRVLQTLEELDSLRAAWDALAASRSPLERFAWMRACAESFGTNRRLRIFVLERNGRVRAIAPLVMGRGGRRELLGVS
jgi:CelD/BcsL family acetyltransferase involved in cellulose biosynthesis